MSEARSSQFLVTAYADDVANIVLTLTPEQAEGIAILGRELKKIGGYVPVVDITPVADADPDDLP